MRFQIIQGYYKFTELGRDKDGKKIVKEQGGFIEDTKRGILYAILDTKKHRIVSVNFIKAEAEDELKTLEAEQN